MRVACAVAAACLIALSGCGGKGERVSTVTNSTAVGIVRLTTPAR